MLIKDVLCKNVFNRILSLLRSGGIRISNKNLFKPLIKSILSSFVFINDIIFQNNHKLLFTVIGGKQWI